MVADGFEQHYAEKIWDRIPELYRDADERPATPEDPGGRRQLRALVEVLAAQAAVLRRSTDRLWDDQLIDLCDDWAVPYLADLVGTRLVSALDRRGRRVDVANTVHYRRRAGTVRLLEQLVVDIAGWEGLVVEQFQRLGRTWHGLDPQPGLRLAPVTRTPRGGTADLRRPLGALRTDGAFDEYARTPDVRRHRAGDGRFAIPKLAFHLYRLAALPVVQVRPRQAVNNRSFTLDPLGRAWPLFARADRPLSWDDWRRLEPWQAPGPISCGLLNHAEFALTPEAVAVVAGGGLGLSAAEIGDLETLRGRHFASSYDLRVGLESLGSAAALTAEPVRNAIEAAALVTACAKWGLLSIEGGRTPSLRIEVGGVTVPAEEIVAGDLSTWRDPPPGRRVVVDPSLGRLRFATAPGATVRVDFHVGWVAPVGATTHPRPGLPVPTARVSGGGALAPPADGSVVQLDDSRGYVPASPVPVTTSVALQAADRALPFLELSADWVVDSGAAVDATLVLDGLWLHGGNDVVIRGDFAEVRVERCTLDPGTEAAGDGVGLRVEGNIGVLRVGRSVLGPVTVADGAVVGLLEIADSIIEARDPSDAASPAIGAARVTADIARSTVAGVVGVRRVWSTDSLYLREVRVADTQSGCFRFSSAPAGSRVPHPYESTWTPAANLFTTARFPRPGFRQLGTHVGPAIARGAESGSELGAYSAELGPISLDSLQAKVAEYLPIGRLPLYHFVT